jgi:hypothetical protein
VLKRRPVLSTSHRVPRHGACLLRRRLTFIARCSCELVTVELCYETLTIVTRRPIRIHIGIAVVIALASSIASTIYLANSVSRSDRWSAIGAIATAGQTLLVGGALVFARRQLIDSRTGQAIERVLDLHDQLTTGEVGAARHRLGTALWTDTSRFPTPDDVRRCGRVWVTDRRNRQPYESTETESTERITPGQDIYRILWCFQRAGETYNSDLVDKALFIKLIGHHVMWWDTAIRYRPRAEALELEPRIQHQERAQRDAATADPDTSEVDFDSVPRHSLRTLAGRLANDAPPGLQALWRADIMQDFGTDAWTR